MATHATYEANSLGTPTTMEGEDRELFKLANSITHTMGDLTPRVVVFVPVENDSSASEVAGRFASTLSLMRQRSSVSLIDGNLQSPTVHRFFPKTSSLEAALSSEQVFRQMTQANLPGSNLLVLAPGPQRHAHESAALLSRLKQLLETQTSGVVVLVAPPATDVFFFAEMASVIDGVILVIEADQTRRKEAKTAVKELQSLDLPLLGAVLNGRTFPIPEFIYKRL